MLFQLFTSEYQKAVPLLLKHSPLLFPKNNTIFFTVTMVLGGAVKVVKGENLKTSGAQTEGMIRMNAIADMSDQICGTGALLPPIPNAASVR